MELKEIKNTGVLITTEQELDEYLLIIEEGGWRTQGKQRLSESNRTMMLQYLPELTIKTCNGTSYNLCNDEIIITLAEFKKEQGIMKYKAGDVLVHEKYEDKEVLGVCGLGIFVSRSGSPEAADGWYHISELEKVGWSLKTDKPAKTDMTVSQLEVAAGLPAGSLNVVAES